MYRNRIKRLLDVFLSACGILCLSWLLLLLAVAIKLDSPGPVFFRQKRVGIGKRHFQILKFRTMRIDTPHDMPTHLLHDKISSAAASILMNKGQKPIVCLTGPSGSGKTTTAMRLREYLENLGVKVCMLSMDNFFLPLDQRPPEASDWESPYCVNRDLLIEDIHRLMDGELVELPVYDFKAGGVGGLPRPRRRSGTLQ